MYVAAANASARAAGIAPGMRVSAAQALVEMLVVRLRNVTAEQEAAARLAAWSGQYTSQVTLVSSNTLLLEVAGSEKLFGDLPALMARVRKELAGLGYTAQLALAPTPLAATWLARAGRECCLTDYGPLFRELAELPLTSLGLAPEREALLTGLGLRTLVDCLRLPRDGIARRAGRETLEALDRAFGRQPDPRAAFVLPERFHARLELPAPVDNSQALLFPLHRLLLELAGFLEARGVGAATLEFELRAFRAEPMRLSFKLLTPSRDASHLVALVRERLERFELTAPVEEVQLNVDALQPLGAQPLDFFERAQAPEELRAQLVERLQARLGREAVQGIVSCADHRPERAWRYVAPGTETEETVCGQRPVWLLPAPLPLAPRAGQLYLHGTLALEPERERIESGWWDDAEAARDYFIARAEDGRRLWVFRDLRDRERWFLQGIFA